MAVKSATSTTQDTLRNPMSLWPSGFDFENLVTAWHDAQIGHYFFNTVKIAVGSWLVQLVVAVTGGYVLGILQARGTPGSSPAPCSSRCSSRRSSSSFRCS